MIPSRWTHRVCHGQKLPIPRSKAPNPTVKSSQSHGQKLPIPRSKAPSGGHEGSPRWQGCAIALRALILPLTPVFRVLHPSSVFSLPIGTSTAPLSAVLLESGVGGVCAFPAYCDNREGIRLSKEQGRIRESSHAHRGTELLSIQPGELKFPFELKKQISSSRRLVNSTDNYVAFKEAIERTLHQSTDQHVDQC